MNEEQTKCPNCDGTGIIEASNNDLGRDALCHKCEGTGQIQDNGGSQEGPRSPAAHGWAALRLIAEPTRAGWWLEWDGRHPHMHYVTDSLTARPGLWIYHDGFWRRPAELRAAGWAGPVELDKASPVESPPNDEIQRQRGEAGDA